MLYLWIFIYWLVNIGDMKGRVNGEDYLEKNQKIGER